MYQGMPWRWSGLDYSSMLVPMHDSSTAIAAPDIQATRASRRTLVGMGAFIVALHVVGWGILLVMVATHDQAGPAGAVLGLGMGATVYALGLRHAFDADHIAAIDNTTRKLIQEGQRPVSVGF